MVWLLPCCAATPSAATNSVSSHCLPVANLVAVTGQVSVKPQGKVLKVSPGKLPRSLCAGDEVHTFAGRALIDDGRYSVAVDQFSLAAFSGVGKSTMHKGQALFEVRQRQAAAGVEVKTRLSVIGVKGTRFLVRDRYSEQQKSRQNAQDAVSVALDQGVVEITSTQGPVELYREPAQPRPVLDDYAQYAQAYAQEMAAGIEGERAEFQAYKTQIQGEFVAYVENLQLHAGKELVTQGRVALERAIRKDTVQTIKLLKEWSQVWRAQNPPENVDQ